MSRAIQFVQQRPRVRRSGLSKPSLNQLYIGATRPYAACRRFWCCQMSRQNHGCPQFQRFSFLASGDLYGAAKARLRIPRRRPLQQQFTAHPIDLGFEKPFVERAGMLLLRP